MNLSPGRNCTKPGKTQNEGNVNGVKMFMTCLELTTDLPLDLTKEMIRACAARASHVLLATPMEGYLTEACESFLTKLVSRGARREVVSEWPGTKLFMGETATVYRAPLTERILNSVLDYTGTLFSWRQPNRPEDLCFLDETNAPIFFSTSHECYAQIFLTDEDLARWHECKALSRVLELSMPIEKE